MSTLSRAFVEPLEQRLCLTAPTQWQSRGPGGGGAFFAPSFSPFDPAELYVVTDMSGVFRSTNTGTSWQLQHFSQLQGNRASRVQFTADTDVRYVLDYSMVAHGAETVQPKKTLDGGTTWTALSGWTADEAFSLHADPGSTTRLVISDYRTLYFSNDGGNSFVAKYTAPNDGNGCRVAGAFFDGSNIYVGTNRGLLVSNNGGSTFSVTSLGGIPASEAIASFAGAKQGTTTRFFCITFASGSAYPGLLIEGEYDAYRGIYSHDVGQPNWTLRTAGIPAGDYPSFVSMAQNDIHTAYVAGASTIGEPSVSKTTNGGADWSRVLVTDGNGNVATGWQGAGGDRSWGYGELAMDFQVAPMDSSTLAFTDFGYVHLSTDGGVNWRQAYVNPADQNPAGAPTPQHKPYRGVGLEDTSALWLNWTDANRLQAGYTDIVGVRSTDGGVSWAFPTYNPRQNTIYSIAKNLTNSTLYAASSNVHDIYQSTYLTDARIDGGTGRILYSTDDGNTWNTLHDFGRPVVWVAVDPTDPNRAYASVVHSTQGGIFTTTNLNAGTSSVWTKVTNPPRTEGHPFNIRVLNDGALVVTYSGRRTSAFTNSSGVFYSTDHGATWSDRTDTVLSGMRYYTKDITIDPTDPTQNTWWCAVRSGWSGTGNEMGGLYKTTNRGLSWTRVFSADSVESVTIHPATGEMYIATLASGLWYCPDVSVPSASLIFSPTSYPFRQPERIFINPFNTNEIWVASFGYGLAVGITAAPAKVNSATFNWQTAQSVSIQFSSDVSSTFAADDVIVKNLTTNQVLPAQIVANGSDATITFPGNIPLPDGHYQVTLLAAGINDGQFDGNGDGSPGEDFVFLFEFLNADATRDGQVTAADFNAIAQNFNQPGTTFSQGNFNYDAVTNALDFNILATYFGQTLSPAALPSASPFNSLFSIAKFSKPTSDLRALLEQE